MDIAIIAIGAELMSGNVTDTNTGFLARLIDSEGWRLVHSCQIDDDPSSIVRAIDNAMQLADVVLTTGGLGPTKDDLTKEVMAQYFGGRLVYNEEAALNVERIFKARGLEMNRLTATQAMVPDCCKVIPNMVGTAPVMWFERSGKVLIAMPGVPREMRHTSSTEVIPRLRALAPHAKPLTHRFAIVEGVSESLVNEGINETPEDWAIRRVKVAYLPQLGYLKMRFDSPDPELADRALSEFYHNLFPFNTIALDDVTPAEALVNILKERHLTLATAESCTGGNIAHKITEIAGCSEVYMGGIVSYSNEMKINTLGVNPKTIKTYGAVSEQTVAEMVAGASRVAGTTTAIATSGIAGPGGGSTEKPVGTVCIGVYHDNEVYTETFRFPGTRTEIIERATVKAIVLLLRKIL